MLKKIRISVSLVLFAFITLYFIDFGGFLPEWTTWLTKIQFIPALLALNLIVLGCLVTFTLIFGRVYCSSICPMGVYQDIVAWCSKRWTKKKRYTFSRAKLILRWSVLGVTFGTFLFGFTFLLGLLDPYGAYGRMATHLFRPAYLAGNNLLASIFTHFDNYTFYRMSVYVLSVFSLVVALLTMLIIGVLAWRNGRTYCNTICPVGTVLGFLSRFSLFKIQFVEEKCNSCGLCSMRCKASCIDSKSKEIDYSRCVDCFNCIEVCNRNAMKYASVFSKKEMTISKPEDASKRRFFSSTMRVGLIATSLMVPRVLRANNKRAIKRELPIAPPGTPSVEHLREKCISCHLCVSKCPSHVIQPAFLEYGLGGMMQPKLYFEHGFCNYDCTVCGDVCPTGAILPLSKKQKHQTQMGKVMFVRENCIVVTDETNCGACSEHCPTQAVSMIPYKGALTIPFTKTEICVGCGGCEYVCPAIPNKAIYVEGLAVQNQITLDFDKEEDVVIDDFGF